MLVVVGLIIVMGAVLGGFTMAGGEVHSLMHPSEVVTIGGAAMGALVIMSTKQVLVDLVKSVLGAIKGSPFTKAAYTDLFKLLYDLLRTARRDGMLALETHLSDPHHSPMFEKYPLVHRNHHACEFICGAFLPVVDGSLKPEQLADTLEKEIRAIEEQHHAPLGVLQKTADGLPGFGIVAAVLGIVITMGAIDGPVEEVGHKVGAALVGTFLGILMSYGLFAPLAARLELLGVAELTYFRAIATAVVAFADNLPPKIAIDQARRLLSAETRLSRQELDELFAAVDSAG